MWSTPAKYTTTTYTMRVSGGGDKGHKGRGRGVTKGKGGRGKGGFHLEVKPIDPGSKLATNVAALLANAPGRQVDGCQFKRRYIEFVGEELDLKGGKLVELLARCEAAGVCRLERRPNLAGPPTLFVHGGGKQEGHHYHGVGKGRGSYQRASPTVTKGKGGVKGGRGSGSWSTPFQEVKPVDPGSKLATNVAALLASSPGRQVDGCQFKQRYAAFVGEVSVPPFVRPSCTPSFSLHRLVPFLLRPPPPSSFNPFFRPSALSPVPPFVLSPFLVSFRSCRSLT
jgi:hypothetical protein